VKLYLRINEADPTKSYCSKDLAFNYPDGDGLVTIRNIKGKFTTAQIKRIMEVTNEAEFV